MQQDCSGELGAEIRAIRRELNELLDDEELYWGQRAKDLMVCPLFFTKNTRTLWEVV